MSALKRLLKSDSQGRPAANPAKPANPGAAERHERAEFSEISKISSGSVLCIACGEPGHLACGVPHRRVSAIHAAERQAAVLKLLADKPRAWLTEERPGCVVVALAIRGVATAELTIPAERFDPFRLLEIIGGDPG